MNSARKKTTDTTKAKSEENLNNVADEVNISDGEQMNNSDSSSEDSNNKANEIAVEDYPAAIDNHPIIAREGWPFIIGGIIAAIVFHPYNGFFAFLAWLFVIFSLQFFRDPKRQSAGDINSVLSPADGKVIAIEKCLDPIRSVQAIKISIFMNVFNVHSNRSPINGTVISKNYFQGKFINADFNKASIENERNALVIRHDVSGVEITCIQIAGLIARRILCYVDKDDTLLRGERYGFIRFGSRVDLYLPEDAQIRVGLGENVCSALDIIAKLPQK